MKLNLNRLSKMISKNSPKILKTLAKGCQKHSPEIFTGLSVAGVVTTGVLAAKGTVKAVDILKDAEEESEEPLTIKDKVGLTWKCYVPAASSAVTTGICVVGINAAHKKRTAAVVALYKSAEHFMTQYDAAVSEVLDEDKYQEVVDKLHEKRMQETPVPDDVIVGKGDHLCYDPYSGRYFSSNKSKIDNAVNYVNKCLLEDSIFVDMNTFYLSIGMDETLSGEHCGWRYDSEFGMEMVESRLKTRLTPDGEPVIILGFNYLDWEEKPPM